MQKFKSELRFYLQSVVAHVDNVTEETTIDVLDDRAGADLARVGVLCLAHPFRSDLSIPFGLELWNRILKSLIKVGCPISDFIRFF